MSPGDVCCGKGQCRSRDVTARTSMAARLSAPRSVIYRGVNCRSSERVISLVAARDDNPCNAAVGRKARARFRKERARSEERRRVVALFFAKEELRGGGNYLLSLVGRGHAACPLAGSSPTTISIFERDRSRAER